MKFVIDMNLGPEWIDCLATVGHTAVHWSTIGRRDESDAAIMRWAHEHDHIVLTADLDFGILVVRRGLDSPSVVQLRMANTLARHAGDDVLAAIQHTHADLAAGALVTVENQKYRVRRLSTADDL